MYTLKYIYLKMVPVVSVESFINRAPRAQLSGKEWKSSLLFRHESVTRKEHTAAILSTPRHSIIVLSHLHHRAASRTPLEA